MSYVKMSAARSLLVLAANTRWVYALAKAVNQDIPVHAVRFNDWQTYWKNRPSWPDPESETSLERTHWVLPPGYAGRLERVARPFMRLAINQWRRELHVKSGEEPYVVAPYPYLAPWLRSVPRDRLIYYNLDAYTLYRPERTEWIRKREDELVERSGLTVCLSQTQVDALRTRHPAHADRIEHFPLGVLESFLNPNPEHAPRPDTVGYVGNLTDRVDWAFVRTVTEHCPSLRFVFAGSLEDLQTGGKRSEWRRHRDAAFQQPNVNHIGRIPQDEVTDLYWNCAVNWIPYDTDHPFNQASCPTKIMDAIASGRPVVSTPVPESTLYPEWIDIVDTPKEASDQLHAAANAAENHPACKQVAFAQRHTWSQRANQFLSLTSRPSHVES